MGQSRPEASIGEMDEHETTGHAPVGEPEEPHGAGDHGADGGHDDHGHAETALGPVDWSAWGAGLVGVGLGLVVAFCLLITLDWLPA